MSPWDSRRLSMMSPVVGLLAVLLCCGFGKAGQQAPVPGTPESGPKGVLVVAHGGSSTWNAMVRQAVAAAKLEAPTEVAFGMGMTTQEARGFQEAVDRLEQQGVSQILVVPLLVSSHSTVFRQFAYLFGQQLQPEWSQAGPPLHVNVPVVMGRGLDDSPLVADILLDRARALSRSPSTETVVLVAHGPVDDEDQARWLAAMEDVAARIQQAVRFRDVISLTMRDDAPEPIRSRAAQELRALVQAASRQGRVLVIPVLMARGGVEHKIPKLLRGLRYAYDGQTLLPHAKIAQWIAWQAARLAEQLGAPIPSRGKSEPLQAEAVLQDGGGPHAAVVQ